MATATSTSRRIASRAAALPALASVILGLAAAPCGAGTPDLQTTRASATLPVSKDNVIFGVRSVDARGHRGPAVVPLPQR